MLAVVAGTWVEDDEPDAYNELHAAMGEAALAAAKEEANRLPHDNHSGGSSALIGNVKERWKELGYDNPDRVEERFRNDPWRLFYNGWIEGRVPLITGSERPTTGIDVEGVMRLVNEHDLLLFNTNRGRENFRKALEAYAEKGGDNLRKG